MQKEILAPVLRSWLRGSRRPMVGEEIVTFRLPNGRMVFADGALENELFVMRGDRITVLDRGVRHIRSGLSACEMQRVWYVRYRSGFFRHGDRACLLDAFDGSWRRTTIGCDALEPGKRFVYEG